jgi:hypothetical protein
MNSIVPQNNDFDLFAKLIVMDQTIRRKDVNGVIYFAIIDVLSKMMDSDRDTDVRMLWGNLKRSKALRNLLLNLQHIHFGGRGRPIEGGDYETILNIVTSMSDKRPTELRMYINRRMAQTSETEMRYLLRQQSEGKALAAEEIRNLHEIKYLPTYDDDDAFTDMGYNR